MVKTKKNNEHNKNCESSSHLPLVEQDITTVNVLGSCFSRDIFNANFGKKYKVEGYVHGINPLLIFEKTPPEYHICDADLAIIEDSFLDHAFNVRMMKMHMNGGAWEQLITRKGDWIILDTYYAYNDLFVLRYSNGQELLFQGHRPDLIKKIIATNDKFKNCSIKRIDGSLNFSYYVEQLADFLRENWGDKIILINSIESGYCANDDRSLTHRTIPYECWESHSNYMAKLLIEKLKCDYIQMPFVPITVDKVGVHYIYEIHMYLKETVDAIINGHKTDGTQYEINEKYKRKIDAIVAGKTTASNVIIKEIALILTNNVEEDYPWSIENLKTLSKDGYVPAQRYLGRAYRDGKGVPQDLEIAAEWMRKAADKNIVSKNELFDILWEIGTGESYNEMISVAETLAETGDGNAMGRLGRAYRDGKGVPQDLEIAAEWMRKAYDNCLEWSDELFDILWRINTPESLEEMISMITPFAELEDGNAMIRLGRAYRDGKGVPQDLEIAAEWMRKAADKNITDAGDDLSYILRTIEKKQNVIYNMSNKENGNAMIRLGRAYRDGKGVQQNLEIAAEWMRKAVDKKIRFANIELFDILWMINTPESLEEMISMITPFAELEDGNAMIRLGRAYRDGKGVQQNLEIAAAWIIKAAEKDVDFSKLHNYQCFGKIPDDHFVAFSGTHSGGLFNLINLKSLKYPDTPSVLFVSGDFNTKQLENLISNGIFQAIIRYGVRLGLYDSAYTRRNDITEYFDAVLNSLNIEISNIDVLYTVSDGIDQPGAYFKLKNVRVVPVELHSGKFTHIWQYETLYFKGRISEDLYLMQRETHILCGEDSYDRICYNESYKYSDHDFDNTHSPEFISKEIKKKIVNSFESADYNGKTIIALNSNRFLHDGGLSENNCKLFIEIINRYFTDPGAQIGIKLHPRSNPYIGEWFTVDNITIIPGSVNIDLITYMDGVRLSKLITFNSSTSEKIGPFSDTSVRLGSKLYAEHKYYPVVEYLMHICKEHEICLTQNIIDHSSWTNSSLYLQLNSELIRNDILISNKIDTSYATIITSSKIESDYHFIMNIEVKIKSAHGELVDKYYIHSNNQDVFYILKNSKPLNFGSLVVSIL
jgi:TPR repeat protein